MWQWGIPWGDTPQRVWVTWVTVTVGGAARLEGVTLRAVEAQN